MKGEIIMKKRYSAPQANVIEIESGKFLVATSSLQLYSGDKYKTVSSDQQLSRESYNEWDNIWK